MNTDPSDLFPSHPAPSHSAPSHRVLIVGAGPAGMAAANAVLASGWEPVVIDENPRPGGQIWREARASYLDKKGQDLWHTFERAGGIRHHSSQWVMEPSPGIHVIKTPKGIVRIDATKVVLCTGGREQFLPFPGWTLPGVYGAGALQALVKMGLHVEGRRIVVAGSGPLLLAVAALLRSHGAQIVCIAEQANIRQLFSMAPALLCSPSKMRQTLALQRSLKGIPTHFGTWPVKAEGTERLMTVHLRSTAGTQAFPCDMLACGFHLLPNTELAQALGCTISHGAVHVNEHLATSRPGIYAAGETLGIGGVECAIIEGAIAGYAACSNTRAAQSLLPQRHRARRFANTLNRAFSLRQELRTLCDSDTVLCRCEDVRYRDLSGFTDWRSAKLNTRCGMGACQGRVCGSINQFLFGWEPPAIRTPISSTPIQTLADGFSALNSPTTTNNEKNIP